MRIDEAVAGSREGGAHRLPDMRAVVGGDFAGDDDPTTGCHHLHRHPCGLVVVEDVVGDLIGQLVRMTSTHRLGSTNRTHKHTRFHESEGNKKTSTPLESGREDHEGR